MENLEKKMQVRKHNQMQNAQLKKGCNPYETQRDWAKKVGRFFSDSEKCTLHLHNYSTCGPLKTVRIV